MGGGSWSDAAYNSRVDAKLSTHGTSFDYDHDVHSGKAPKAAAPKLDPSKLKLDPHGVKVRESRDSKEHPLSMAVMINLDVTGSMRPVVTTIHQKLPSLMGLLTRKGYLTDPQIMFSAVGDATCDSAPLQIGQFESDDRMEDDIGKFYIESGGGGQNTESYELMAYVGAKHTAIDCLEKRGKRGFYFVIGDEKNYPMVKAHEVNNLMDVGLQADIPVKQIYDELKKKYHVFFVFPLDANNGSDSEIPEHWAELIGKENVLKLEKAEGIAELIALQIGLVEGTTDLATGAADLKEHGTGKELVHVVTGAVSKAYAGGSITKVPPGTLTPSDGGSGGTTRL